ncbi:hypothetical protein SteCoe_23748 [Stentor coeruleus]|uniref:Uncharacterized protein n=1 Tax=Stentor coeruleus TaxID=5963 RepID=A0A1R2BJ67_9CILI|nr:hypothetical protein SteCoe_23748 [Stentor coeruleus]
MALKRTFSFSKKNKQPSKPVIKQDPEAELFNEMIEKEHELERVCEPKVIHDLISIYTRAIEYYSQKHNQKYLDFQSRMHKMLIKPEVLSALKQENSSSSSSSQKVSNTNKSEKTSENSHKKAKSLPPEKPNDPTHPTPEVVLTPEFNATKDDQVKEELMPILILNDENTDKSDEIHDLQAPSPPSPTIKHIPHEYDIKPFAHFEPRENIHINNHHHLHHEQDGIPVPHFGSEPKDNIPYSKEIMMLRRQKSDITKKNLNKHFHNQINKDKNSRSLKIIIDRHVSNNKNTANKAAAELKSQESALERRLASRQKIKLTRSMSFTSTKSAMENLNCDLSELYIENDLDSKSTCFTVVEHANEHCEKYEKKLEEIMEKNFAERALKIAEIKHKYETQMSEIAGMGDIMQMLVQQMKTNMKDEIDTIVDEYDKKRKEEIAELKIE